MKVYLSVWIFLFNLFLFKVHAGTPCSRRYIEQALVCVCNSTYCDTYDDVLPTKKNSYIITSTSQGGLRFDTTAGSIPENKKLDVFIDDFDHNRSEVSKNSSTASIAVNFMERLQRILGFGGGFTGSVSHVLGLLPQALQDQIYKTYYSSDNGINYNTIRLTIGGCDFDLYPWAYADQPEHDETLSGFTHLNAEDLTKILQIRRLENVSNCHDIKNFASLWSPPVWMKTFPEWGGKNKLLPEYYEALANYYLRWLKLMAQQDVNIWGLSTGNEPLNGIENWKMTKRLNSLGFTALDQGAWVGENFGPLLRKSEFSNIKLFASEDQIFSVPWWFVEMNKGYSNATNYVDGIAFHWYADDFFPPEITSKFHEEYPDKLILNTESCVMAPHGPPIVGEWSYAEIYARRLINNFLNRVEGWIDWNLILDMSGGPNWTNGVVASPINVNTTSKTEFYKTPIFYTLGHFSKYLDPKSVIVQTQSSGIQSVAFERPDKMKVAILFNILETSVNVNYSDSDGLRLTLRVPPKSVHTLAYTN